MMHRKSQIKWLLTCLMLACTSASIFAQGYKGSIHVTVQSEGGEALPGAYVTVSASTFNRSFVTDGDGVARFVGLVPGAYEVKAVMSGFNTVIRPGVRVETGQNVKISVSLAPSTQQEELVVTAETPLMDTTKVGTSTVLTTEEITMIPSARDPWAVMDTIPGLQTDRVNVGGNESGQQAQFVSKGDDGDQASWIIDGVEFTDFAAEGGSQSYLDFGSFQEIGFSTGGADASNGSSGAVMNFVTKSGTNKHSGAMRLLWADENFSSSHDFDDATIGNSVVETFEKGFDIGGPIVKDKVWYWGAFSQNTVDNIVRGGARDKTNLENLSLKIHADITDTTRFTAFYQNGDKQKDGRGAGTNRPTPTTVDQDGPTPIYKYEISQLIGQNTELQFIYGRVDGGFNLVPKGGQGVQTIYDNAAGTWLNSWRTSIFKRPQRQYVAKGTTFLISDNMDHEFKYGFEYKEQSSTGLSTWGDDKTWAVDYSGNGLTSYFWAYRDTVSVQELEVTNLYIQDTVTMGNLTLKGGLRYNSSEGKNLGGDVGANPIVPDILPALNYNGDPSPFEWQTLAPMIGATYTFGDENQYLVRGSYRKYFDPISTGEISYNNPVGTTRVVGVWDDLNGDGQVDPDEASFPWGDPYLISRGVDPECPSCASSPREIDPDLEPPEFDEFLIGGEWSITPGFTLSAAYTYRVRDNEIWFPINHVNVGLDANGQNPDYMLVAIAQGTNPVSGESYSVPMYELTDEALARNRSQAGIMTNRPDYKEIFHGLELTATKRLSDRWMLRGYIAWQDWTRDVGPGGIQDPTVGTDRSNVDGAQMVVQSGGSGNKGDVWLGSAAITANANFLYQLPWDLNISGNLRYREGFAAPMSATAQLGGRFGTNTVSTGSLDTLTMDDLFVTDIKLTKVFNLGSTKVDLGLEVFNLFNDDTVLQVSRNHSFFTPVGTNDDGVLILSERSDPVFQRVNENLSPRLARFSATVNF